MTRYRRALLAALMTALSGGAAAAAETAPLMITPQELVWSEGPPTLFGPRYELVVIHGDPKKEGMYAIQLKIPANYKFAPHRHPVTEHATVLSGTLFFAQGEKYEPEKGKALPAGSFFMVPAGTAHFAFTKEPTVIQVHAVGPSATEYVDPADDARKKQ